MTSVSPATTAPRRTVRRPAGDLPLGRVGEDPPLLAMAFSAPEPGVLVVHVNGELDLASAPELDARLRHEVQERAPGRLILDLSRLQFLGLHGIAVFERLRRRASGAEVALAALSPSGTRALAFAGVLSRFDRYPDVTTALAVRRAGPAPGSAAGAERPGPRPSARLDRP